MPAPVPTPEQLLAPHEVPDVDMQAADQASKQEAAVAAAAAPPPTAAPPTSTQEHQALQERIGLYLTGALTSNLIMLGDKMGLYAALKAQGPCTAAELAAAMNLHPRYVTEWLRQQASARLISTDDSAEKFWLTPAQQDVLVNEHGPDASPNFFAGMFMACPAMTQAAATVLPECFRTGRGISYDEMDKSVTCAVCRELGVWARHALVPSLCSLPGMRERLEAGCKVADVGCGCGEALLTVAAAFPASSFSGYDIDKDALREAKAEAARRGLTNCAFFDAGVDEERMPGEPTYQLVMTHDAIHDMAHPQAVLAAVRRAMAPDGVYVIGDMSALDSHGANVHQHPMAAMLYGFSVHCCLPSGMSAPNAAGLGTMGISEATMGRMLRDAGFASCEVLDWAHPMNRYYLAKP